MYKQTILLDLNKSSLDTSVVFPLMITRTRSKFLRALLLVLRVRSSQYIMSMCVSRHFGRNLDAQLFVPARWIGFGWISFGGSRNSQVSI